MASVQKHLPILTLVKDAKPKLRKSIVLHCDEDLIRTIDECVYNTLNGNIPLKACEIQKLEKFKTVLRKVLKTKGSVKKRKAILQGGGGFLPVLLKPIVTAAAYSIKKK